MTAAPAMVSVVVPCRNERRYIGPCLDSILATTYPKHRLEILVVDGQSDDGTTEVVQAYIRRGEPIRLVSNPRRIVPTALNLGIRLSAGDVVLRMDAHNEYPADYIPSLVSWLERTGADNVGGAWITRPGADTPMARAIAAALSHPFGVGNAAYRFGTATPVAVDTVPFGCFRREVFQRVGLFDEELIRNQDDEFNARLIRAGGKILLVPGVVSYYHARTTLSQLARMNYQYGYFKPLAARKVGRVMTWRQLAPALLVLSILAGALLLAWPPLGPRLAALPLVGYFLATSIASMSLGRRHGARCGALLLVVFPVIHLSYGVGFLRGLFRVLGRGRSAAVSEESVRLSR
jgi:glycosyltransferase involved in cell wall biosynthesis